MGNQHGSHAKGGVVIEETLESMQKEKQRDEHLKNLEFKRSKSIRKSIAKRLKGGKKRKDQKSIDQPDAPPSSGASEIGESTSVNLKLSSDVISTQPAATNQRPSSPSVISAASSSNNTISKKPPAKVFEKEDKKSIQSSVPSSSTKTKHKTERIYREDANRKPLVGEPQPFPTHVQVHNYVFDITLYNSSPLMHMAFFSYDEKAKTCFYYNAVNIGQLTLLFTSVFAGTNTFSFLLSRLFDMFFCCVFLPILYCFSIT